MLKAFIWYLLVSRERRNITITHIITLQLICTAVGRHYLLLLTKHSPHLVLPGLQTQIKGLQRVALTKPNDIFIIKSIRNGSFGSYPVCFNKISSQSIYRRRPMVQSVFLTLNHELYISSHLPIFLHFPYYR